MKLKLTFLILAAALAVLFAPVAVAQSVEVEIPYQGIASAAQAVAEDGSIAMYCKYIGTSACASITVDAGTGDLTFTDGTCGAESATDTFECPVAGALGGVIDVSNAACNTIGEVVDIVNASSDWRCLPYAALRTDSSNDTLVTIAATQATTPNGLGLAFDSSVFLSNTVVVSSPLAPPLGTAGYEFLGSGPLSSTFKLNPWYGRRGYIQSLQEVSTYAGGTSNVYVYAVDRKFGATGSETVTTLWGPSACGATTVAKSFGACDTPATGCDVAWGLGGLWGPPNQQLIVRLVNSTNLSAEVLSFNGLSLPAGSAR